MYFCTVGLLEFPEESCAVKVNVYSPALGFGNGSEESEPDFP